MGEMRGRWVAIALVVAGATAEAVPALAQSQAAGQSQAAAQPQSDDQALQEVVVTARKREETFENVPITVNVFTQQDIQSAGIENPRDFIAMVPNMTLVETQNVGNSFITIRGISQARNSEPSVAVLVDGVLEPNPYEFDQELYDISQIQVLKGPQGALYGRDAIGGAILITTVEPGDQFEGEAKVGVGNGPSEKGQLALSGPLTDDKTLKFRASLNYYNTDGYLQNVYLDRKADPDTDYAGRLRLIWKPSDQFSADLRFAYDFTHTTAYYFVIPRSDEANPFSDFTTPPNANDTSSPIQTNNLGADDRTIQDTALKLDYTPGYGTFTGITDYNHTKEIDTGDAYDFRPVTTSVEYALTSSVPAVDGGPFDESQAQFVDVQSWSQELRFTSPKEDNFSYIGGVYFVHTERFISTDNIVDRGEGSIPNVYYQPLYDPASCVIPTTFTPSCATNTNATFLADGQNNNAYAIFGDGTYDFTRQWELDIALRYDEDRRQNTTLTPTAYLPTTSAFYGEVRKAVFRAVEPKGTVRYKPSDNWTLYADWSRGFRSGGFNQTGVGALAAEEGIKGVNDIFQAEIADTYEVGTKVEFLDRRLSLDGDLYHTQSKNGYFFVYVAADSTQNLGNLNATYKGAELSLTYHPTRQLDLYVGGGYTDSRITAMADPTVIGNQAPLVSRDTINAGVQYHQPVGANLEGTARLDFQQIGRTWWDPYNVTSRDPVNLVNLRLSLAGGQWTGTLWSKNLTNTIYNAEFSPGAPGNTPAAGFLWRALPRTFGLDLDYRF